MPTEARPHKITERCLALSPRSPWPYQCRHCAELFRTKHAALGHECKAMTRKRSDSGMPTRSLQASPSAAKQET